MRTRLNAPQMIAVSSMLFGMFFGAGNLIFPAALGPAAGSNLWTAYIGLFITAVGLPLLAVAALGISRSEGVQELAGKVSPKYAVFFSTLLYLTIGPLFAIPRCASTSFAVGMANLLGTENTGLALMIFSFIFFVVTLLFSLKPGQIMTWIGRILNPLFLLFLAVLVVVALMNPIDSVASLTPSEAYAGGGGFFRGFLEGYNTLDALAGLAFGIVVVTTIRRLDITDPGAIARNTAKSGIFSCLFMGLIYLAIALVSAQSSSVCAGCENGGAVLGTIATYYFGKVGTILITVIVTLACLKTAVGLVISCGEAFVRMFPKGPGYKFWAVVFSLVSFGIANFGLSTIVAYCVPVLMFLYPLSITLIILALVGRRFDHDRTVYVWTTAFTLVAAVVDFLGTLSSTLHGSGVANTGFIDAVAGFVGKLLPFSDLGLGWVVPAGIGFLIGLVIHGGRKAQKQQA